MSGLVFPTVNIVDYIQPFITFGLPIIVAFYAVRKGLALIFGSRR
jgi:hypothetical protein